MRDDRSIRTICKQYPILMSTLLSAITLSSLKINMGYLKTKWGNYSCVHRWCLKVHAPVSYCGYNKIVLLSDYCSGNVLASHCCDPGLMIPAIDIWDGHVVNKDRWVPSPYCSVLSHQFRMRTIWRCYSLSCNCYKLKPVTIIIVATSFRKPQMIFRILRFRFVTLKESEKKTIYYWHMPVNVYNLSQTSIARLCDYFVKITVGSLSLDYHNRKLFHSISVTY